MVLTWLITGSSSGLGLAFAREILAQGHNLIATSRNPDKDSKLVEEVQSNAQGRWRTMDVSWPRQQIERVTREAWEDFDGIDVLINNAGYSILGAAEDIPEDKAKAQFETNFWGLIRVTQAILPLMRSRKTGTIVNISSAAGIDPLPTCAVYAGSKFALEGWSEPLSREIEPLGLRVLVVQPGGFRTNFLAKESTPLVLPTSDDYKTGPVQAGMEHFDRLYRTQRGDPMKAAQRIFEIVTDGLKESQEKDHFLRIPLGPDCYARARQKLEKRQQELGHCQVHLSQHRFRQMLSPKLDEKRTRTPSEIMQQSPQNLVQMPTSANDCLLYTSAVMIQIVITSSPVKLKSAALAPSLDIVFQRPITGGLKTRLSVRST